MPRRRVSSLIASSRLTIEPAPAATTTPVSSSRVGRPAAATLGERKHQGAGGQRPGGGGRIDADGGQSQHQGEQRGDRGAARHAEHVRVGQRVAQQHLQQRPGQPQQSADGKRGQRPRQAQVEHDVARERRFVTRERLPDGGRRELRAAEQQRQQQQPDRGGGEPCEHRNDGKSVQAAPEVARKGREAGRGDKRDLWDGRFTPVPPM